MSLLVVVLGFLSSCLRFSIYVRTSTHSHLCCPFVFFLSLISSLHLYNYSGQIPVSCCFCFCLFLHYFRPLKKNTRVKHRPAKTRLILTLVKLTATSTPRATRTRVWVTVKWPFPPPSSRNAATSPTMTSTPGMWEITFKSAWWRGAVGRTKRCTRGTSDESSRQVNQLLAYCVWNCYNGGSVCLRASNLW